jgi:DNA-binding NarL/FixJ family response regulator
MTDIVVLDDSRMLLHFVKSLLKSSYQVVVASPGSLREALNVLYDEHPAILITDYEMPNLCGESVVRAIWEDANLRDIKVLMLSSHHEQDIITRVMERGVAGYILKGGGMKEHLIRRIDELLAPQADEDGAVTS